MICGGYRHLFGRLCLVYNMSWRGLIRRQNAAMRDSHLASAQSNPLSPFILAGRKAIA